ncbi:CAMP-dependent protein kinase regulatory subunit, putative [Plasmodium malariae]|uniref:cAMP-dependent protein kinase regulatory subunit, putative n=1 Tax=Plasmodium malariae TaxID=5858 RepID=A0A1D3TEY9_PLAMA|nr:CAMP-dependent protein kinase regulatory subunit, putative [Plasmodium malariae]SCP03514.1 CAMP-dependent protein kinase regulatory subunit, putative [Plasmodium malariae]
MGNVCTWRQGKENSGDQSSPSMQDKDIQEQFEKYEQTIRSNSKKNNFTQKCTNVDDSKNDLLSELSINKREDDNSKEQTINNDILGEQGSPKNENELMISLNKKNIISKYALNCISNFYGPLLDNYEQYSSDEDETECLSEMDRKEMELKESDLVNLNASQGKRMSVSAEAYGEWNKKKDNFVAKVYKKDEHEKAKIREALNESFLFNHLNKMEMETIVDAFFDENVEQGVNIINEGDDGDLLYVIDEGEVEIYKTKENGKEILTILKSKDVFGELALLYNSKRAATAKALTKCHLWALDRESFTYIIKDNVAKKRQMYEDVLKQITILKGMDPYERSKVADCLKTKTYSDGDIIINEGEQGDTFYILIEGNATALKDNKVIKTYNKGDYFGELALLKNQPRAATVKAQNTCQVVYLDRKSFKRLLGPIEEILHRNVENYKKVLKQLGLDTTCIEGN